MIKFKLVILKQTQRRNGNNVIFLRLTQKSKVKYISTNVECDSKDWIDLKETIKKSNNVSIKNNLLIAEFKNHWINKFNILPIDKREQISIDDFISHVNNEKKQFDRVDFFEISKSKIETLKSVGKIGSANCIKDTMNSVLKFTKISKLNIESINVEWLKKYELHLRQRGCVENGISVRMRAIRTLFNECIEDGLISSEKYPFKTYKISKLKQNHKYRAINVEDIKLIENLDTNVHPQLKLSKDLFMFSYHTGGMNFKDLMLLKLTSVYNNNSRLTYTRSKTNGVFDFKLNDRAKEIVEYYKTINIGTEYLFPILLKNNLTPLQIANRRHKCISKFNRDLKTIGMICNIDFDLTSYVARHSFASNLKGKGIATDTISEAMGHQNIKVTQTYLKKLENEVIDNAMDSLT
jgi:site-specific recombinase XerD